MDTPEFSRLYRLEQFSTAPLLATLEATGAECAALAKRFDLFEISYLSASIKLSMLRDTPILTGQLQAKLLQNCVVTDEPVPVHLNQPITIRFISEDDASLEIELDAEEEDEMPFQDGKVDAGEAIAQSLALSLDPFPRSPAAQAKLKEAGVYSEGEEPRGALADLRALLNKKS